MVEAFAVVVTKDNSEGCSRSTSCTSLAGVGAGREAPEGWVEVIAPAELVALILPHLEGVKGPGSTGNYDARCPFHDDRHASFSIHATSGLWECHGAGCGRKGNAWQLAKELGCVPEVRRRSSSRPAASGVDWGLDDAMKKYGVNVHQRGVIFPVYDHAGERCRDHVRLHRGEPRFQYWGRGRTYHCLVEWDLVRKWARGCGIAYLVEGDTDWLTLAGHGWPAIGILGIDHFGKAQEEAFPHIRAAGIGAIVITPDSDEAGLAAAQKWAEILRGDGFLVGIRTLPKSIRGQTLKDLFDLYMIVGGEFNDWLHEMPIHWRESWA